MGRRLSKHRNQPITGHDENTWGASQEPWPWVRGMRQEAEVSLWHMGSMQTSPPGHLLSSAQLACSVLCLWEFSPEAINENIALSYLLSPTKHPVAMEFPIDSHKDAYACYSEGIDCAITM